MSTWQLVLPPSRPDTLELDRIRATLGPLPRSTPVAVLGSTIEFRDLLAEMDFRRVFVLSNNPEFHAEVSAWRIYRNAETFVEGDWRKTLPEFSAAFGAVLSDLTAGNIPYEDREEFYGAIALSLRPGGYFIDKNLTNHVDLLSIDEIERRYSHAPVNLLIANYFSCEALFCSELQRFPQVIDTTDFYRLLAVCLRGPRFRSLIRAAQLITPKGCRWYYGRPWSELAPGYCRELTLNSKNDLAPNEPYHGRGHQYIWSRN